MRYLLLHGFTGSPDSFDALTPPLSSVVPVLAGHSNTPISASFWDEVERLAKLGEGCQGLLGYSLGGRFALGLLARYPQRFAHALVLSAHPGLGSEAERSERRQSDARYVRLLREQGLTAFVDAWEAAPLWDSQRELRPAQRARQREQRLGHTAAGLAASLVQHGLAEMPNLRPMLAKVATPVELLVGERDPKFTQLGQELCGILPGARLSVVPGAGHNLILERSELCSARLLQGKPT